MDPRKLKRLLDTYRDAGVVEAELDDKLQPRRVRFGAMLPAAPAGDVEMEQGADTAWTAPAPLALQQAHERILSAYKQPAKGRAS